MDHVTYCVPDVNDPVVDQLAELLSLEEFQASEAYEAAFMKGRYVARWFSTPMGICDLHLVEGEAPADRGLEHLCFRNVGHEVYERCAHSPLCVRNSGSGRVWLRGPGSLRVEVQP